MKFYKKKLDNGLTVLFEKRDVEVTTVMLAVKYGSIFESEKEKGIAHFIEHLCFKGTKKRSAKEIAESLEKVGGNLNAFTSEEETAYHVKLPSKHLELAMDVIFDIFFNPVFPEEEIKKEANVICEEIKMYNDSPQAHTLEKIKSCLYNEPFGMFIVGTEENVRSFTREKLLEKHDELYCAGNAILSVVGNNEFSDVVSFAEKFSVNRKMKEARMPEIKFRNLKLDEKRENLQQASVAIGFHFPNLKNKMNYAADVFSAIFGEGMSSKLFTEVREKRGLAYAVRTSIDDGKGYSYLMIYIGTEKEKVDEVIRICIEEFKKMAKISEKELEEGKQQVMGGYDVDSEDCANTALSLIISELVGKAEEHYEYKKNIEKVSLSDIKKLSEAAEYSVFQLVPR